MKNDNQPYNHYRQLWYVLIFVNETHLSTKISSPIPFIKKLYRKTESVENG